jgi:hypothetical protein
MQTTKPAKEIVRQYMQQRITERSAPPGLEAIRTMLGWKLIEAGRK